MDKYHVSALWLMGFAAATKSRGYPRNWAAAFRKRFEQAARTAVEIINQGGASNPLLVYEMEDFVSELRKRLVAEDKSCRVAPCGAKA